MTYYERQSDSSPRGSGPVTDLVKPAARVLTLANSGDPMLSRVWRNEAPPDITNHFRALRSELMMSIHEQVSASAAATIMVTSALPGDGKTFVAASLARTFAHAPDTAVTLLDFDLIRRSLSCALAAQRLPGIGELMLARCDVRRVSYATDISRLHFIPAGSMLADSREYFMGTQAAQLMDTLRSSGSSMVHILDAPPIIPIVEAAALASKVDLVVLVVRAGVTPRAAVEDAIARIGSTTKLCMVMNAAPRAPLGHNYDYAYSAYGPNAQDK